MSPGGKRGRKLIGPNNQDSLDLPESLPRMKGVKSKETEPYSFHPPSEGHGALRTGGLAHPHQAAVCPDARIPGTGARHLALHSADGVEEKATLPQQPGSCWPPRQPVGSNEMESRRGGRRGEQWGLGGQHYPTTRFLRPGGQGVPVTGQADQIHPWWLLPPLSNFSPP